MTRDKTTLSALILLTVRLRELAEKCPSAKGRIESALIEAQTVLLTGGRFGKHRGSEKPT